MAGEAKMHGAEIGAGGRETTPNKNTGTRYQDNIRVKEIEVKV